MSGEREVNIKVKSENIAIEIARFGGGMGDWQIETALGVLELDEKSCEEEFNACIQAIQVNSQRRIVLYSR